MLLGSPVPDWSGKRDSGYSLIPGETTSDLKVIKQSESLDDPFSDVSSDAFLSYSTFPVSIEDQGFCFILPTTLW